MTYRVEATSVAGFIQQLAVAYVAHGYYFYVSGLIPEGKNPAETDRKIIAQYSIDASKWTRARRKKAGLANVQYLRLGRFFVILATYGQQPFFEAEARQLRDIRIQPLHCFGYSVGSRRCRGGNSLHASVRIERAIYVQLKAGLEGAAVHRSVDEICEILRQLPLEPYAPVRDQLRCILRAVNRRRVKAGLDLVPTSAVPRWRSSVRPFAI